MRNYKVTGAESKKLIASAIAKKDVRKIVAPKILGNNREAIIETLKGYYSDQRYEELLREHLKTIKEVLSQYTGRLEDVTMMIKNLRKSFDETTNRKTHSERAAKIGRRIAEEIGINANLTEMMLEVHDIGHTPFGHDGEVWISNVLRELGIGQLLHNAEGARRPLCRDDFFEAVITKIKEQNPTINKWKLQAIRENLWVVLDGILTHNGEGTEKIFWPDTKKTEETFRKELLTCFTEKRVEDKKRGGIDKNIFPATIEGCLLRICDFISYTARDFVDGMREGMIDDVDSEYISKMKDFGIPVEVIQEAIETKNYEKIARAIEDFAIRDVILNSSPSVIQMTKETAEKLFEFRQKNNSAIVDYVTRTTENTRLPVAIRAFIIRGMKELTQCGVIEQMKTRGQIEIPEEIKKQYISIRNRRIDQQEDSPFITYIEGVTPGEIEFAREIAEQREESNLGVKLSEEDAIAAIIVAQAVANMTDDQLVQVLQGLDLLTDLEVADMHVKYKDIPREELHNVEKSEFMKKLEAQQEADLKAIKLGLSSDSGDGRDD